MVLFPLIISQKEEVWDPYKYLIDPFEWENWDTLYDALIFEKAWVIGAWENWYTSIYVFDLMAATGRTQETLQGR